MNTRYRALLKLIIDPVVWKVAATSGIALRTAVEDMGERRPHHDMIATMIALRCAGNRSYWLMMGGSEPSFPDASELTTGLSCSELFTCPWWLSSMFTASTDSLSACVLEDDGNQTYRSRWALDHYRLPL